MIHVLTVTLFEHACICSSSFKCVDARACFTSSLRACVPYAIECSLDVPVRHIVAFYLAAHYHVSLVSVSVLELKAISC